jgi:hypothetical protein
MKIADVIKEIDERVDDLDYCSRQLSPYLEVSRDRYRLAIQAMWMARDGLVEYLKIIGNDLPIDWSRTWEKG